MSKHGIFEVDANPYTVTSCEFTQPLVMNPRFRLWLITTPEIGTPLPAVLIRYGVKLAWDDKLEFETSVQESFVAVWNKLNRSNKRITELQIEDVQVSTRNICTRNNFLVRPFTCSTNDHLFDPQT